MRQPFPLQWPEGYPRTTTPTQSRFGSHRAPLSFDRARRTLLLELERLGAINVVLTSDLPLRRDGSPYATSRLESDPGIAVWFLLSDNIGNHVERVLACDRWRTHTENMHALALTVEAMRGIERWGAADVVARAFAGFTALPPGQGEGAYSHPPQAPKKRTWREVLGETFAPWPDELDADELLVLARSRYRKLIKFAHPDVASGSHEAAAELNAALAEAEQELT